MKRTSILLACVAMSAVSGSAIASAQGSAPEAHAGATATVELRLTKLGFILTTSSGLTLYMFTHDQGTENSCMKIFLCSRFWPALETSGTPTAGFGVKSSLLSTIELPGGAKQLTYAGHALYTYVLDKPGSTGYVGVKAFGGNWDALHPSGQPVT
jgi:predicted lipoprotein with Yx(FWY)xxD motif